MINTVTMELSTYDKMVQDLREYEEYVKHLNESERDKNTRIVEKDSTITELKTNIAGYQNTIEGLHNTVESMKQGYEELVDQLAILRAKYNALLRTAKANESN